MYTHEILSQNVLGRTRDGYFAEARCAQIAVSVCLKEDTLTFRSTLWHEFCHAEGWINEGAPTGHAERWLGKLFRKPFLAFWDLIVTPFIWPFIKRRND